MSDAPPGLLEPRDAPLEPPVDTEVPVRQIGQWTLVWRRFRRHRLAVIGAWIALGMLLLAVVGPLIAPPMLLPGLSGETPPTTWMHRNQPPQLWPFDPRYMMGADPFGNPVLSYVLDGARADLAIGVFGALIASLLGILIGALAGYLGRLADAVLMRLVDAALAIPFLLLLVLLSRYLTDRGVLSYTLLFGAAGWPGVARLVRGYVLALRRREFAEAARALGVSTPGIIFRHILPNALDVIVVSFTLNVGVFLITEITLEYLGAGVQAGPTWGALLPIAFGSLLNAYWWLAVFPGLALLLAVLASNFLGDGLRDALDATSRTALFTEPYRERPSVIPARSARALASGVGSLWTALSLTVGRLETASRWRTVAGRVERSIPARLRPPSAVALGRPYGASPWLLRVGPIALTFAAVGCIFLYGHSPLRYAPNYDSPRSYGSAFGESEYAARTRARGGWALLYVDGAGSLVFERVNADGRVAIRERLGSGDSNTRPSMAESGGQALGAWVGDSGQTIVAAYLHPGRGGSSAPGIRLVPDGGLAEHPFVVAVRGGFDVLFDWQRPGQGAYDLELASLRGGRFHPALVRLVRSGDYALYPRAALDGSGALDVAYLQRSSPGVWRVRFRRFTPDGRPLGRSVILGRIDYVLLGPNGCNLPNIVPGQWAIDLKRASGGSVWATWETGSDCVSRQGVSGTNVLWVGAWSAAGTMLVAPRVIDPNVDASSQAVALAVQGHGGQLYYQQPGEVQPVLAAVGFDGRGRARPAERVAYDSGVPTNPRAGTVGGRPRVIWEKVRTDGTTLEGTAYHPARPPDLLTHLGLNIGNLWANLLLLIFGALGGSILLTLANAYLLAPLLLVWLLVRRLTGATRWTLYITALAVLLAWVFAAQAPPRYTVVLSGLAGASTLEAPYRWLAVAGAVFVAAWSNRYLFERQESPVRAMATALGGLYFVFAMYLVLFIMAELTRI